MRGEDRVIAAHTRLRSRNEADILRRSRGAMVRAESGLYSPRVSAEIAEEIGAMVSRGVARQGELTTSYLDAAYRRGGVEMSKPREPIKGLLRQGSSPAMTYERVPATYRRLVSSGIPTREALEGALNRLGRMIATDVQLAHTETSHRIFSTNRSKTQGYRRVIRPELSSKSGVCGLCIAAADQVYSTGDLLPIHDGCNCTVLPITAAGDPGLQLNRMDLDAMYQAGGSTKASDLRSVRIRVDSNGETGPTLVDAKYPRGKTETEILFEARPWNRPAEARPNFPALVDTAEKNILRLERDISDGVADASSVAALEWNRGHLESLLAQQASQAA